MARRIIGSSRWSSCIARGDRVRSVRAASRLLRRSGTGEAEGVFGMGVLGEAGAGVWGSAGVAVDHRAWRRRRMGRIGRGGFLPGIKAGDFLFAAIASGGVGEPGRRACVAGDGLKLSGCYISATARCAPPGNKPLPEEMAGMCGVFGCRVEGAKPQAGDFAVGEDCVGCGFGAGGSERD